MMNRSSLLAFSVLSVALSWSSSVCADEPLQVGVAEVDITPPLGFPMAGYYHERLATGTIDPLKAKAIVFRQGDEAAALVACDLTGIARDLTEEVRKSASQSTGIPAEHIVLAATHSHTAPDYTRSLYKYLSDVGAASDGSSPPYPATLIANITKAIDHANQNVQEVAIAAGLARQEFPVSFNRRFLMRDGSVRTWMKLNNPDVLRAAGPIDPEIGIVTFRARDGDQPLGVLTNFALHLDTVDGTLWSADYPYFIEQSIRQSLGDDVVSIFGNGCCGDINHSDPTRAERNTTDVIGRSLGATIETALGDLQPAVDPVLRVRTATVMLPLREVSPAEVLNATDLIAAATRGEKVDFFELVAAYRSVMLDQLRNSSPRVDAAESISWGLSRAWGGVGDFLPAEVETICLGDDVAIVCLPGEVFVELGLAIKEASPFRTTLIVELCNCVETAYIPTRAACAGGSYEVTNSTLQPGGGEMLVEAALRLLRETATEATATR
jgi:Neutral/alkaline non-lysosomal ceramidase, N-terminal